MNQSTKWIIGIIIVIAVVAGGYLVSKGPSEPAAGPIKLGLVAPMSGEAASYGEAAFGGATLAVKEINGAGGIDGRKIELVVEDDTCSSAGANAFTKLTSIDNVVAIVGPVCSASAGPAVPIAQKDKTPVILIGASAPNLTKVGTIFSETIRQTHFRGNMLLNSSITLSEKEEPRLFSLRMTGVREFETYS